jgi:hypothetical protein
MIHRAVRGDGGAVGRLRREVRTGCVHNPQRLALTPSERTLVAELRFACVRLLKPLSLAIVVQGECKQLALEISRKCFTGKLAHSCSLLSDGFAEGLKVHIEIVGHGTPQEGQGPARSSWPQALDDGGNFYDCRYGSGACMWPVVELLLRIECIASSR